MSGISAGSPTIQEAIRTLQKYHDDFKRSTSIEDKVSMVLKEIEKSQTIQQEDEMGLYLYDTIGVKD